MEEVDYLKLAARLLHDKHYGRALSVLSEVDEKGPDLDRKRFYFLRGLASLKAERFKAARRDLSLAIKEGQSEPAVHVYVAQACFRLEEYSCVASSLANAPRLSEREPGVLLMKAEAQWRLAQRHAAVETLTLGAECFPDQTEFDRALMFYLIDLGLYVEASTVSQRYLSRSKIGEEDFVAVGEALSSAKDYGRAQRVLEQARLRFPESVRIIAQLAHTYLNSGRPVTAAMLFEEAARLEPKYTLEAAEVYKEAGLLHRARRLNARVGDQKAKAKQRLSLLVNGEDFEAVAAMLPGLSRLGLLSEQSIRYAVAYAFFKTRQFKQSESHLKLITDPSLLDAALKLRKVMESCRAAGWQCVL